MFSKKLVTSVKKKAKYKVDLNCSVVNKRRPMNFLVKSCQMAYLYSMQKNYLLILFTLMYDKRCMYFLNISKPQLLVSHTYNKICAS